ncbi:hypothetical protein [Oceanirhabdus sp. W0125-5]|uniref:hypothetical protein n=1 Tax=Oceanirhabdus sp. W0125-5 TaxID=2999116 RepID=UPI0022F2A781|nr:hypothetical protein [Oceanirhabdus sp. W0125-5]WBW95236.1 hypothetical protein OW730_16255 [Oceanirhabdus sp. W0125-5]
MDMVLYDNYGSKIDVIEIPEKIHQDIFLNNDMWRSYLMLKRISDYYLTNIYIKKQELEKLKIDLKNISRFISDDSIVFIEQLINKLSSENISRIHISGD